MREAVAVLFRQKKLIMSAFLIAFLAVLIITLALPNTYKSRMKVLVKNSRAEVIVSPEQTSNMVLSGEVSEAQVNSEIELMRSRDLLEAVVKKAGLVKKSEEDNQGHLSAATERAIRQLEKDLSIQPVKKSNIIEVTYSAESAALAASVLQTVAELYLERHLQVHRVSGSDEFFKSQATEYEQKLKDAELALASYEERHDIVSLSLQKEMGLKRVFDAETDLQATDTTRKEIAQRAEKVRQQLQSLDARVTTQQRSLPHQYSIERLNTIVIELQNKRTQLLTKFQSEDRLVKEVDQQIADTKATLERVSQQQSVEQTTDVNPMHQALALELARAQAELTTKQARQDSLSTLTQEHRAKLATLESTTLKHAELERKVKEMKDNYQLFAKKRDDALITAALDKQKISNVSIAENPSIPGLPSSPNRKMNLVLGLFLAGFLGLGSGIGAEFLRDVVHTPQELEAMSEYPVLATVPHINAKKRKEQNRLLIESGGKE